MKRFILAALFALSTTFSFAATCEDTMAFHVGLATQAAAMGITAKEIGEKHKVKKIETTIASQLFFFSVGIKYIGKCKRVKAAIRELFELESE